MKTFSPLQIALAVSVAIHALLLTVRFVAPDQFDRLFTEAPLEVILVNAKSSEKPENAKAIAQFSLAGGGDLEKGRATSPLLPSAATELGDSADEAQRQAEALQTQQTQLLAQIKNQIASLPVPDFRQNAALTPEQTEQVEKRRQLVRILAEIEKRINEENARPKKRYISPSTREAEYAVYYDTLRRRVEEKGTLNFPELAGKKLYGELTLTITVNHDGNVIDTEVVQSSGIVALDRRAQTIVKASGPFGIFTEVMRRRADQIVVVSRFKFTRDEVLETKQVERQ